MIDETDEEPAEEYLSDQTPGVDATTEIIPWDPGNSDAFKAVAILNGETISFQYTGKQIRFERQTKMYGF